MKNILLMTGVGVGLFCATVVGVLGGQGRLNYEGTKGVPILSMFFSPPPPAEGEEGEHGEGEHGDGAHGDGEHGENAHGEDGHAEHGHDDGHGEEFGVQHEGLGKEEKLKYTIGESPFAEAPKDDGHGGHGGGHGDDGHGGGHGDAHGGGHGDDGHGTDGHGHKTKQDKPKLSPPEDDFQEQMESLLGQAQYRRGNFFKFPRLEGDISVEQLNRYLRAAKLALDDIEKRRSQLEVYESELEARQRDIEDRERMVSEQMSTVETARTELDKRIRDFQSEVLLVRRDEVPGLKEYAATLGALEPQKAMEHVVQSWETETGRDLILKVLAHMEVDKTNAILAELELPKLKEVLTQRLRVVIEKQRK